MKRAAWRVWTTGWVLLLTCALVSAEEKAPSDDLVEKARKIKDEIADKLHIKLTTEESDLFLIHSDMPPSERTKALKTADVVYAKFCEIFDLQKDTRLWEGKYVIVFFRNKAEATAYWRKLRNDQGHLAAAIQCDFGPGIKGYVTSWTPEFCSDQTFCLCWYMAPAFLKGYVQGKPLAPWISAGFSGYCCNILVKGKQATVDARRRVKENMRDGEGRRLKDIRQAQSFSSTDTQGRRFCFSIVDYMISLGQKKFVSFMDQIKGGAAEDDALQTAFGMTAPEFEKRWLAFVEMKY